MMMPWMPNTASVQAPARRPAPEAGQEADGRDQQQDRERGGQPVLRELAQQFVVEGRACPLVEVSLSRTQRTRLVASRRRAAAARLSRRRNAELLARHRGHARAPDPQIRGVLCIINLKGGLKDLVNGGCVDAANACATRIRTRR